MARYHLTEAGDPGVCRATQGRCPYGGSREHYSSAAEARESFEAAHSMAALLRGGVNKNPRLTALEAELEERKLLQRELYRRYAEHAPPVTKEYGEAPTSLLEAYNEAYRAFAPLLTEEEASELHRYTGLSYHPLNSHLRDPLVARERVERGELPPEWLENLEEAVVLLDSALAKAPRQERQVFRRIDQELSSGARLTSSEEWAGALGFTEGAVVTFPAYSSTTVNPRYINRTVQGSEHTSLVLSISTSQGAPTGLTAVEGGRRYVQEGEAEVLLPRESSFTVASVERAGYSSSEEERVEVLTVYLEEA